jgi:uncharacterized protein involved in response to NO
LPSRFDPLSWHIHAMLFGFVPAAIAGFMLTAIPNWSGRPPIHGAPLAGLAALWLMGRFACLVSGVLPLWLTASVDLAFPVVLTTGAARRESTLIALPSRRPADPRYIDGVYSAFPPLLAVEAVSHRPIRMSRRSKQ